MQIKMTMRYHLKPIRMTKIDNTDDSLCWKGCGVGEHSSIADGNALYSHSGNPYGCLSENLETT